MTTNDDSGTRVFSHTQPDGHTGALLEATTIARGTVLAGRYVIEGTLGRGGMGVVVRARDTVLGEDVALKILRPEYAGDPRWVERLAREVKLARQIRHPNVCRVFDFEQADGHAFLVMELASGGTLRREIDSGEMAAKPLDARLADACAVATGLAAIHEAGVVHRDVTPQNVLRLRDGRPVVSDFGLALEASHATTSMQGGTVAYMAPEIIDGAQATFASDVWSLGIIIQEVVFGDRPKRAASPAPSIVASFSERRRLTGPARRAAVAYRMCATAQGWRRPRACDVVAVLQGRSSGSRYRGKGTRLTPIASGVAAALLVVAAVMWTFRAARRTPGSDASAPRTIAIVGDPTDWTSRSKVLAQVAGRIACLRLLPDRRTLRFLWGWPYRAEDIDVVTAVRRPSPLVPDVYRDGCPDLNPDGRLVYQRVMSDGSPVAFVSPHPDGRDGVAVAVVAEPSMDSEPVWLPDSDAFVYDADGKHTAVFSMDTRRVTILPEHWRAPLLTTFKFVTGKRIYVAALWRNDLVTELVGLSWPDLAQAERLVLPIHVMDLVSNGDSLDTVDRAADVPAILRVSPDRSQARRLGTVRDQVVRYPNPVAAGMAFVTYRPSIDGWRRRPDGSREQLTHDGHTMFIAECGAGYVTVSDTSRGNVLAKWSREGTRVAELWRGPHSDDTAACSSDGARWFHARTSSPPGLYACSPEGCSTLLAERVRHLRISPDGSALAFLRFEVRGPRVAWMSVDGGPVHDVADAATFCAAEWAGPRTLWVSSRQGSEFWWTEVSAADGRATGRTVPGSRDCTDGKVDPSAPVTGALETIEARISQIRFVASP